MSNPDNGNAREIEYKASPTLAKFHRDGSPYRGILGPRGSGKSTGCCFEGMRRSQMQAPSLVDGIRRSRGVIVRNTYGELSDTALKTWLYWFDENYFGAFNYNSMTHRICFNDVEMEVMFRALDRPKDIKKLLSLELTWAWVNEAREIPKGIIDGLGDCVGRWPPPRDGGATWAGVFMDTNPPDTDHWWYKVAEEIKPEGWRFWRQPGGLIETRGQFLSNPKAENIDNLKILYPPTGYEYYYKGMEGKSKDHIRVYYCAQYGFVSEGKPVHPEYVDSVHCAHEDIPPVPGIPLIVGLDFGLTPAALISQRLPNGRWIWIDELVTEDMGASRFADVLGPKLRGEYRDFEMQIWGDPAGEARSEVDERTVYQILNKKGIPAKPAPTNDFSLRTDAVSVALGRIIDGKPGLMLSPKCKVTRKGLAGGYCYKRMQVANEERYHDKPNKNKYSHVCEAGQYAMIGAGEGDLLIKVPVKPRVHRSRPKILSPTAWMGA